MDEKKVKLDIGSVDEAGEKLGKGLAKGFKEGVDDAVESLSTGDLRKKFDETFTFKGLKGSLKSALAEGSNVKNQSKMTAALKKNAELSKKFSTSVASGASKSKILSDGLALASSHGMSMLKNINPYVMALKAGLAVTKQFLATYQKTLKESSKFIGQGSLFTDKNTMQMMQRTGQSAAGAQGTNRSLDRLGMSFEDIQTGLVTKAQMQMFEQLRKSETERLETIAKVGGPVFESMQYAAVAVATAKAKFTDMIQYAYGKSKGVLQFAKSLEGFATNIGNVIWGMKDKMSPIIGFVGELLSYVIDAMRPIGGVIKAVISQVAGIVQIVQPALKSMGGAIKGIMNVVGSVFSIVIKIVGQYARMIATKFAVISQIVGAVVEAIASAIAPVLDIASVFMDLIESFGLFEKIMKVLQPILDIATTTIKILGAAIGWVYEKIGAFVKGIWTKIIDFVTGLVNMVPKAFHDMINYIIELINKIPGVSVAELGSYKQIDVGGAISSLQGGLNNTLASITGDTFNYNYGTENTQTASAPVANQNLFANMYTLVND